MTKPIPGSNPSYAGVADGGDLPSFWTAVLRFRHRHGLSDVQRQPLLDDEDLRHLRDPGPARDFAFDADLPAEPSHS